MSNTAQNRIASLLDANSFVEIGGQITARSTDFNLAETETPSDGVITGYGVIDGNLVYVYSQDASVLNGTVGEMHAAKIVRLYNMAQKTGAPVIGLVDCAGMRLQEATDALNAFGEIYLAQTMASGVIPQITGVFGTCGGGMALVPGMTDFTFMEKKNGKIFVNSPNALDGNIASACDTASAEFVSKETALVDFVGTEDEILANIRSLVTMLPANNEDEAYNETEDDLNRACENLAAYAGDTAALLAQISDDGIVFEAKAAYAPELVTALIQLNGATVGAIANRTEVLGEDGTVAEKYDAVLSARGAKKAADFVKFCDAFSIPVLTLVNVTGFKATKCSERSMAKDAAALTYAFANANVPKVSVVIGKAYGSAYLVMNSKSIGADMVFAWPNAEIGMMDAKAAAKIMYAGSATAEINKAAADYKALQNNVTSAARRGYVDTIIAPEDTRKYVIGAFEMLYAKNEDRPAKKHGTI